MGLMLHAGAEAMTREQVRGLAVPQPMGRNHVIRPFIEDIEMIGDLLYRHDMVVADEAFGVKFADLELRDKDRVPARFFGAMDIQGKENDEFALTIGLRGSYDQSLPRGLAVGSRVFVCDNLAFSSDITVHTRQTTFLNDRLPRLLEDAVNKIPTLAKEQSQDFISYKDRKVTHKEGDAIFLKCMRKNVLGSNQFAKAIEQWDTYRELDSDCNLWSVYNVVTDVIKPIEGRQNILNSWGRTTKLTQIVNELVH